MRKACAALTLEITCISLSVAKHASWERKRCLVLSLGETCQISSQANEVEVRCFRSERELLRFFWRTLVHDVDPDIVVSFQGDLLCAVIERGAALDLRECCRLGRISAEVTS
ncbi:hypothetical protein T484DRAFT_1823031 [Baffinella frigidus]|nr:hypothetical protein T484DRAFT_1823031 [Cryptophyta sp. CCMP2293]